MTHEDDLTLGEVARALGDAGTLVATCVHGRCYMAIIESPCGTLHGGRPHTTLTAAVADALLSLARSVQ